LGRAVTKTPHPRHPTDGARYSDVLGSFARGLAFALRQRRRFKGAIAQKLKTPHLSPPPHSALVFHAVLGQLPPRRIMLNILQSDVFLIF